MGELRFTVYGKPATKGSLKPVKPKGSKRIFLVESHTTSKPFRVLVAWAARDAISKHVGATGEPWVALDCAVEVDVVFSFRRPASAPKTMETWPSTQDSGDLDKLQRNFFDALQDAGVLTNDARIVRVSAEKAFCLQPPSTLSTPGAEVTLRPRIPKPRS